MNPQIFKSDFLVIGSGIAGLSFAIYASKIGTVHIITKKNEDDSNTNYAQGGIAAVMDPEDSFESHISDTIKAGAGLCSTDAVDILVREGPSRIKELIQWGVDFSTENGIYSLGLEGGHSNRRILHSSDLTGKEIERALLHKISKTKNIKVFKNHMAVDLLTEHQLNIDKNKKPKDKNIHCHGAYVLNTYTGVVDTYLSNSICLATGGAGQTYLHTTNPDIATGDGIAMAYRAGALIADMEFIQFHPTTLYEKEHTGRAFLISEAVRGAGAILVNSRGERFMESVHPLKELAPRDIVARAIDRELKRLGDAHVYLDISFKSRAFLKKRFPTIFEGCKKVDINIAKDPIPVVPAAHYLCGGIVTNLHGKTTIDNLFAIGECAHTGVHGANRLASNSLLEAIVFSHRAYEFIKNIAKKKLKKIPDYPMWDKEGTIDMEEWVLVQHNIEDVKRIMWNYVGIVRSDLRLDRAYKRILMLAEEIHSYYQKSTVTKKIVELRNLATVAKLIIKSARARKDSIGLHYNINHPETTKNMKHVVLQSEERPKQISKKTLIPT